MLYYFWKHGRIFPSDFLAKSRGEQLVLRAFYEEELREREKSIDQYGEKAMAVVDVMRL